MIVINIAHSNLYLNQEDYEKALLEKRKKQREIRGDMKRILYDRDMKRLLYHKGVASLKSK